MTKWSNCSSLKRANASERLKYADHVKTKQVAKKTAVP